MSIEIFALAKINIHYSLFSLIYYLKKGGTRMPKKNYNPKSLENLKPQKPGEESHNPNGRPKAPQEFRDLCKTYSIKAATAVYKIVIDNKMPAKVRVQGAELLINHGYGKPKESVDITSGEKSLVNYDISTLAEAAGIVITKVDK